MTESAAVQGPERAEEARPLAEGIGEMRDRILSMSAAGEDPGSTMPPDLRDQLSRSVPLLRVMEELLDFRLCLKLTADDFERAGQSQVAAGIEVAAAMFDQQFELRDRHAHAHRRASVPEDPQPIKPEG
jgi:hypothetical protein